MTWHRSDSRARACLPVPWNLQWYFQLPDDALDCLAGARAVALETYGANGAPGAIPPSSSEDLRISSRTSRRILPPIPLSPSLRC